VWIRESKTKHLSLILNKLLDYIEKNIAAMDAVEAISDYGSMTVSPGC